MVKGGVERKPIESRCWDSGRSFCAGHRNFFVNVAKLDDCQIIFPWKNGSQNHPFFCCELGLLLKFPLEKTKLKKKEREISTMTPKTHEKLQVLGTPPPKKKLRYTFLSHIFQHPFISFHSYHVSDPKKSLTTASSFCRMELHKPPHVVLSHNTQESSLCTMFPRTSHLACKIDCGLSGFFRRRRSFHLFLCPKKKTVCKENKRRIINPTGKKSQKNPKIRLQESGKGKLSDRSFLVGG